MFLAAEVKPASAIELNVNFQVPRVQCGINTITSDQMVCVNLGLDHAKAKSVLNYNNLYVNRNL